MSTLSSGYIGGTLFCVVLVVLCVAAMIGAWRDGYRVVSVAMVAVAAGVCFSWYGINYPAFDLEYHSYQRISGTVTEIERDNDVRMFELKGDDRNLSCTESWCTKVEIGDTLTLDCLRSDGPAAANTWDCEFVKLKETDRV